MGLGGAERPQPASLRAPARAHAGADTIATALMADSRPAAGVRACACMSSYAWWVHNGAGVRRGGRALWGREGGEGGDDGR